LDDGLTAECGWSNMATPASSISRNPIKPPSQWAAFNRYISTIELCHLPPSTSRGSWDYIKLQSFGQEHPPLTSPLLWVSKYKQSAHLQKAATRHGSGVLGHCSTHWISSIGHSRFMVTGSLNIGDRSIPCWDLVIWMGKKDPENWI
jgi:hypothetical protein